MRLPDVQSRYVSYLGGFSEIKRMGLFGAPCLQVAPCHRHAKLAEDLVPVGLERTALHIHITRTRDEPNFERDAIQALVTETQKTVNGEVRLKLYKGNVIAAGVRSPLSLYSEDVATMEGGAEEAYNQDDATGFIRLNGLRLRTSSKVHNKG